ncbi:hypothetical protein Godav_026211 [Gossypium davidsonii]|uniref:Uncharacterized protein n=1 Tax=Gossypium davidsonii TaxID=34287 RepID=A0A7J8RSX5_GOSDV|nr:hypothetical protein [Gossypium davidsonii]
MFVHGRYFLAWWVLVGAYGIYCFWHRMPILAAQRLRVGWPQLKDGDLWLSQGF